jgi:hypothetical protein
MKKNVSCLIALLVGVFAASAIWAAEVSQGKCLQYDEEKKLITVQEYDVNFGKDHPHGQPTDAKSVYSAANAEIGASPKPGDILRIAYEVKGTERVALRVMNVTKQDLMKK